MASWPSTAPGRRYSHPRNKWSCRAVSWTPTCRPPTMSTSSQPRLRALWVPPWAAPPWWPSAFASCAASTSDPFGVGPGHLAHHARGGGAPALRRRRRTEESRDQLPRRLAGLKPPPLAPPPPFSHFAEQLCPSSYLHHAALLESACPPQPRSLLLPNGGSGRHHGRPVVAQLVAEADYTGRVVGPAALMVCRIARRDQFWTFGHQSRAA